MHMIQQNTGFEFEHEHECFGGVLLSLMIETNHIY